MKPRRLLVAGFCLLAAGAMLAPAQADALDQNLIARWTFKDGSLKSDVGDFEFQESARGTLAKPKGAVTLIGPKFLFCPKISAATQPGMRKNFTLWARLKFEELPKDGILGVMGLQAGQGAGGWKSLVCSMLYRPMAEDSTHAGLTFLARADSGEMGVGVQRFQKVSAGEFVQVALVFSARKQGGGMWVSRTGKWEESKRAGTAALVGFEALVIGKLFMPGAETSMTFDEVRVYSTALDAEWLEEITPVEHQ